mmetsp:Transcript_22856/g.63723  ORF Transcript_22856/g.63723 Transcript_22856/m.63723 type:complete len:205 (-) Transcript_22856:265-879(-)
MYGCISWSNPSFINAPSTRCCSLPPSSTTNVGRPPTRYFCATSGCLSLSTLMTRTASFHSCATNDSCGAIIWQGPHHVAYTSNRIGVSDDANSCSSCSPFNSTTSPGAIMPVTLKLAPSFHLAKTACTRSSFSTKLPHRICRLAHSSRNSRTRNDRSRSSSCWKDSSSSAGPVAAAIGSSVADAFDSRASSNRFVRLSRSKQSA